MSKKIVGQLKQCSARSKEYLHSLLGEITGTVADALDEVAEYAAGQVENMEMGGRNILLNSGEIINTAAYMIKQYSVSTEVAAKTKYTVAVKARIPLGHILRMYIGQASMYCATFQGTGEPEIYHLQLSTPANGLVGQWVRFYNAAPGANANDGSEGTIYWACLYEGNIKAPVDWTPAPEDTDAKISSLRAEITEQVKGAAAPATIPAAGWGSDSTADYPYYYDITVAGLTANDRAEVTITPGSLGTAKACGLCPTNETLAGRIRVRAASIPAAAIAAEYWVEDGKE